MAFGVEPAPEPPQFNKGACCKGFLECFARMTQLECESDLGTWLGPGSNCTEGCPYTVVFPQSTTDVSDFKRQDGGQLFGIAPEAEPAYFAFADPDGLFRLLFGEGAGIYPHPNEPFCP